MHISKQNDYHGLVISFWTTGVQDVYKSTCKLTPPDLSDSGAICFYYVYMHAARNVCDYAGEQDFLVGFLSPTKDVVMVLHA